MPTAKAEMRVTLANDSIAHATSETASEFKSKGIVNRIDFEILCFDFLHKNLADANDYAELCEILYPSHC